MFSMINNSLESTNSYTRQIELFIVIAIIGILAAQAVNAYHPLLTRATLLHAVGGGEHRWDNVYYYAFHGQWPRNNEQAETFGWSGLHGQDGNDYIKKTVLENGAVHKYFGPKLPNRIITIHPAVPANDPLGPIIWVCGQKRTPEEWQVFGQDRTNVTPEHIHPYSK